MENIGRYGAALATYKSTVYITGSLFKDNSVIKASNFADAGGALGLYQSFTVIKDSNFTNNNASFGGAIYSNTDVSSESTLDISSCNFDSQWCHGGPNGGGAIYARTTVLKVNNSNFTNNIYGTGDFEGGAIWLSLNTQGTINNSFFENNTAKKGGAISLYSNSRLNMYDSVISNNEAGSGGAIYSSHLSTGSGNNIHINNSTIKNNKAIVNYGGGLYIIGTNTVNIYNSTLENNSVSTSQKVATLLLLFKQNSFLPTVNIVDSIVNGSDGIVIYNQAAVLNLNHNNITNNNNNRFLNNNGAATTKFNYNNISNNNANQFIYNAQSTVIFDNNDFHYNKATDVIYNTGTVTFSSNNLTSNVASHSFIYNIGTSTFTENNITDNYVINDTMYLFYNSGATLNMDHNTFINNTNNVRDMLINNNSGTFNIADNNIYIDNFLEDRINSINPFTVTGEGEEELNVTIELRTVYNNKIVNGTIILYNENEEEIARSDVVDGKANLIISKDVWYEYVWYEHVRF